MISVILLRAILHPTTVIAQGQTNQCGTWAVKLASQDAKDTRIKVTLVSDASGNDCLGNFRLKNETGLLGFGGYGFQLSAYPGSSRSAWTDPWKPEESAFLLPSLDAGIVVAPLDTSTEAVVTIQGDVTLTSFTVDLAVFLIRSSLAVLAGKTCSLSDYQITLMAIRIYGILNTAANLTFSGDIVGAVRELRQILDEFLDRVVDMVKDFGVECAIISLSPSRKAAAVAQIITDYLLWVPKVLWDHIKFGGQSANISLVYSPPKRTLELEIIGRIDSLASDVAIRGDYAYVARGCSYTETSIIPGGLAIINVSDPFAPKEVKLYVPQFYGLSYGNCVERVVIAGNYAYVAVDAGQGVYVVNIEDPINPQEIAVYQGLHFVLDMAISNNYLYTVEQHYRGWGHLEISSLSNLNSYSSIGTVGTPGGAHGIAVAGNYAYVADGHSNSNYPEQNRGLSIVDITNPAKPNNVNSYQTPGIAEAVTVAGNYAYVADGWAGLRIIDVSNPSFPLEAGFYDTPGYAREITMAGDYAYIADEEGGLRILNIANPQNPQEVGFYDTLGKTRNVAVKGNYAYVADGNNGLLILQLGN